MEAKELMIGDWVLVNSLPAQVFEIAYNRNEGEMTVGILDPQGEIYSCFEGYDHVEPIPLTEEILEKNEFENCVVYSNIHFYKSNDNRIEVVSDDEELLNSLNKWYIRITKKYHGNVMMFCEITYVHELQHALRLCGIEKKIEL